MLGETFAKRRCVPPSKLFFTHFHVLSQRKIPKKSTDLDECDKRSAKTADEWSGGLSRKSQTCRLLSLFHNGITNSATVRSVSGGVCGRRKDRGRAHEHVFTRRSSHVADFDVLVAAAEVFADGIFFCRSSASTEVLGMQINIFMPVLKTMKS